MKSTTTSALLAALISTTSALPRPQGNEPPDNTVTLQTPKFHLRALNVGTNPHIFTNTTYLGFKHLFAGDGGNVAALVPASSANNWYLTGTELFLVSGGAQLRFDGTPEQGFPFSMVVNPEYKDENGLTKYVINPGDQGSPNFGNYTRGDDLFVSHMQISQGAPSYGCVVDEAGGVEIRYGIQHVDPITPEGCSEVQFLVELTGDKEKRDEECEGCGSHHIDGGS